MSTLVSQLSVAKMFCTMLNSPEASAAIGGPIIGGGGTSPIHCTVSSFGHPTNTGAVVSFTIII
jgi:hypothetical protein